MNIAELLTKTEPLCKELLQYMRISESLGTIIQHPLLYSVPHMEQMNALVNEQLKMKKLTAAKYLKDKNYKDYVFIHEKPFRLPAFIEIMKNVHGEKYWRLLGEIWINSENVWQYKKEWLLLLKNPKEPGIDFFMDEESRAAYKKLPQNLKVYRGYQPGLNEDGISYTLNYNKAKWFANRLGQKGAILTGHIFKQNVFAYLTGRNEDEIIIINK